MVTQKLRTGLMSQVNRLPFGGRVNTSREVSFKFDNRSYTGYQGDTLASALLANGVRIVARSFKYHRPRGVYSAGVEEPNALVTLRQGERHEPNVPATTIELFDGLVAKSQNRWPSLQFDLRRVVDWFSPIFAAGFYYKTFMGPTKKAWKLYEHFIRHAAGLGDAPSLPDPDRYEKAQAFCDVLIVGGGPAGLAAALSGGKSGPRVVLAEQEPFLGGCLQDRTPHEKRDAWLTSVITELESLSNVRVITRTTVFGSYDNIVFGLLERVNDHLSKPPPWQLRQRYRILRAKQVIVATGMIERPLIFRNNDLPGVMLASGARRYLNRHAVIPGRRIVMFTNNDSLYDCALELANVGVHVCIVDVRQKIDTVLERQLSKAKILLYLGHAVCSAGGSKSVKYVDVSKFDINDTTSPPVAFRLRCNAVLVSGGWTPTLHLLGQRGAKPLFDESSGMFVPGAVPPGYQVAGGATGRDGLIACVESGWSAGDAAAAACGFRRTPSRDAPTAELPVERRSTPAMSVWLVPEPADIKRGKRFVDFQHDVDAGDIALAFREGYDSVEHLKRYTTLGMATDQGKTSNVNALSILAQLRNQPVGSVGTTTYRPPYQPISIGVLAGYECGSNFKPVRRTPMHEWHEKNGAKFTDVGLWKRPWYYPRGGESLDAAYVREAAAVRKSVGMADISTLGKIDLQGPDTAEFLERVYVNNWRRLPVGKARYGVMLRPDGIVFDDGTTSRISETQFFMTTTTGNAGAVSRHLEYLLQVVWPELRVRATSVTAQWAGLVVAGPRSRDLMARLLVDIALDDDAFPFMGVRHGRAGDIPVRVIRLSFSGERAYEIYTPAGFGRNLWERVCDVGSEFSISPYGSQALNALRIEAGHVAGPELDGRTTLADLGLGHMASKRKPFLGSVLMQRGGLLARDRPALVGLEPSESSAVFQAGAVLCDPGQHKGHGIGTVTSVTYSPVLRKTIGLGLLSGGISREGEIVDAVFPLQNKITPVRVRSPKFIDSQGV